MNYVEIKISIKRLTLQHFFLVIDFNYKIRVLKKNLVVVNHERNLLVTLRYICRPKKDLNGIDKEYFGYKRNDWWQPW